jgi:hypothetical protein
MGKDEKWCVLRAASPDIIAMYSGPTMVKLYLECD